MNDQADVINDVLSGYTPVDNGHPAAQALRDNVAALKASEAEPVDAITVEVVPGCIIRPGDVLLLSTDNDLTMATVDLIKAELFRRLPGIADVVVLGRVHVTGVYREGDQ